MVGGGVGGKRRVEDSLGGRAGDGKGRLPEFLRERGSGLRFRRGSSGRSTFDARMGGEVGPKRVQSGDNVVGFAAGEAMEDGTSARFPSETPSDGRRSPRAPLPWPFTGQEQR